MHVADYVVAAVLLLLMLAAGVWFGRRQTGDDFFLGGRRLGPGHLGLSIAATDVGGGFSIGLGGLGFTMGLSASWLLFTGLVGAWLAAVLVVPRVKSLADARGWESYAELLRDRCGEAPAVVGALVSAAGYAAFVGAQTLAGAKIAAAGFDVPMEGRRRGARGGRRRLHQRGRARGRGVHRHPAVGRRHPRDARRAPLALHDLGGMDALAARVPAGHLRFDQLGGEELVTWSLSIIPIWFVAMTLYQRIFAARSEKAARQAFFIAGVFEFPVIALLGAGLGVCARAFFPEMEAESALPHLLREVLPPAPPVWWSPRTSARILSTADSCLLAAAGHVSHDFWGRIRPATIDSGSPAG